MLLKSECPVLAAGLPNGKPPPTLIERRYRKTLDVVAAVYDCRTEAAPALIERRYRASDRRSLSIRANAFFH
jgi:hypothetical protein